MIQKSNFSDKALFLLIAIFSIPIVYGQNTATIDSLPTAFREGRWLSSLSGSVSSNTSDIKSLGVRTVTNEYALNLSTGKFVKDRWLPDYSLLSQNTLIINNRITVMTKMSFNPETSGESLALKWVPACQRGRVSTNDCDL